MSPQLNPGLTSSPSRSSRRRPASSKARCTASTAKPIWLRPNTLPCGVMPSPMIAADPLSFIVNAPAPPGSSRPPGGERAQHGVADNDRNQGEHRRAAHAAQHRDTADEAGDGHRERQQQRDIEAGLHYAEQQHRAERTAAREDPDNPLPAPGADPSEERYQVKDGLVEHTQYPWRSRPEIAE